jgi:hypothetical protein
MLDVGACANVPVVYAPVALVVRLRTFAGLVLVMVIAGLL